MISSLLVQIKEVRRQIGPVADKFPTFFSDASILRFLRARNLSTKRAAKMMKDTLKWRLQYKPEKIRWVWFLFYFSLVFYISSSSPLSLLDFLIQWPINILLLKKLFLFKDTVLFQKRIWVSPCSRRNYDSNLEA